MPNEGGGGYGGLGGGGNYQKLPKRGSGRSLPPQRYTPPPARPQPLSRPQGSTPNAPSRPAPKPKPVSRPAASREQRPNAVAVSPANRIALLQRVLAAYKPPPPSPDRTTGREFAGFDSAAFTGGLPVGGVDSGNGFFPDARGAKFAGYSLQAGSPSQQRIAHLDAVGPGGAQENPLGDLGRKITTALGQIAANSPIGGGVGNVVAQQTWNKIAPLFLRGSGDMPKVSFKKTPAGVGGFTFTGDQGVKAGVTISPSELVNLFSTHPGARKAGISGLQDVLRHEFAHTQQGPAGPASSSGKVAPVVEGGADAFAHATAPLFGRAMHGPATSPVVYKNQQGKTTGVGRQLTSYGRSEAQNFMSGGQPNEGGGLSPRQRNLYKTFIGQFPRVYQRMTPIRDQRPNLAQ